MHSEPCSIKQAIATVARAKLDYVEINEHMSNVLQDVEDIMLQQVSNIFQLSSWVARIISMFKLKVCDKQEWIYMPYDTPMTEETRDELSKTHVELAMAQTTIKNLSEVVVNFSCTSNVLTSHQEDKTPMPQPTPKQTTLQETAMHTT